MSEMSIVSARKARLQEMAERGNQGARTALKIANEPNDFLSTVQIGITLVGIFAGAFGGATLTERLVAVFSGIQPLEPYAKPLSMSVVVGAITYFSLVLGELVPKRLALHSPENVAAFVAEPMRFLSLIASPAVALLSGSTNLILRVIDRHEPAAPAVTEAEIHVLVEQAAEAGIVEESEQEMVVEVLRLGDRKAASLMTPRPDLVWLEADLKATGALELINDSPHARFPVAEGTADSVIGVVESRSIMQALLSGRDPAIRELVEQPLYIPETLSALQLLQKFKEGKRKMALVLDEYGGLQGVVTNEDLFQAILGEVPVAGDMPRWEAVQREDGSWLLDGQMPVGMFKETFAIDLLPNEDDDYHTLAGFILSYLERVPQTVDKFDWHGFTFEIVDLDRHRIDKVLVTPPDPEVTAQD